MMRYILLILLLLVCLNVVAQLHPYTVANAHSHNDYEQPVPFRMAYNAGFGSIEADIFLQDSGILLVAHDSAELKRNIKLEDAYLKPLLSHMQEYNGYPYADKTKKLQMLIDIKTDSINTLQALIDLLKKYPLLITSKSLTWVITGSRPPQSLFRSYPPFISFDGELYRNYSKKALTRIVMMSDDFERYSSWNGVNNLPARDSAVLTAAVSKSHTLGKPVRFWDAPDNTNAWQQMISLRADYINTDHIDSLAVFLKQIARP